MEIKKFYISPSGIRNKQLFDQFVYIASDADMRYEALEVAFGVLKREYEEQQLKLESLL